MFKKKQNLQDKKILIFVGSPRTGSTLLGQVINYHPSCYISNESNLVQRLVYSKEKLQKVLNSIYIDAKKQFQQSLENDKKYGKTINRYQPKWKDMQHLTNDPDFQKGEILYLGDKKAGGTSKVYQDAPEDTIEFFNQNQNVKIIQIIRNPINAAKSLMKSHNVDTFDSACHQIIEKTYLANDLISKVNNESLQIYYEDILSNPQKEIAKVLNFLALETKSEWVEKISSIITSQDNTDFSQDELATMNTLLSEYDTAILKRYQQEP
jgi:hypothetical protein